mmetsp:Transcript_109063/g.204582  ORF Transcript_109063/g.204582 Transcript_109063/m.204582 type:complete len:86 (+) Transcript_109063:588-845(+)
MGSLYIPSVVIELDKDTPEKGLQDETRWPMSRVAFNIQKLAISNIEFRIVKMGNEILCKPSCGGYVFRIALSRVRRVAHASALKE